jgi:ABC-type uncharacterized transport system ATPase subunit
MSEAQKLADHIVLLHHGKVLAEGSLNTLRAGVEHSHRVGITFDRFPAENWLENIKILGTRIIGNRIELTIEDPAIVSDILNAAIQHGGRVVKCVQQEKSLEEIFSQITGRIAGRID